MSKNLNLNPGDRLFASWTDNIQEYTSTLAANIKLSKASSTVVQVVAETGNGQATVGIGGKWRYNTATVNVTVSGAAGTKDIWICAETENNYAGAGEDPDITNYAFILKMTEHGVNPAGVAQFRKLGEVVWSGTGITALKQNLGGISGAQIEDTALSGTGDIEWTREASGALVPTIKAAVVTPTKLAKQPYARVFRESVQSIPNGAYTTVLFNAGEELDAEGMHDPVTNSGRIVAKVAGLYFFQVMFTFAGNTTGLRNCTVVKNSETPSKENGFGESSDKGEAAPGEGAGGNALSCTGVVPMAVNDYLVVSAYQNSGGALNIMGGDAVHRPTFTLTWLSPKP